MIIKTISDLYIRVGREHPPLAGGSVTAVGGVPQVRQRLAHQRLIHQGHLKKMWVIFLEFYPYFTGKTWCNP